MSAATKRTLYRLLSLFLAAGAADAVIQFVSTDSYDYRHLIGGLVVAGIMALEKFLSEKDSTVASPTVAATNIALESKADSVPPPTVPIASS